MGSESDDPPVTRNDVRDVAGPVFQARRIGPVIVNHATVRTDRLAAAADRLARDARAFWQQEQERRQIHDPRPLQVRWTPAPATLSDHWETIYPKTAAPQEVSGDLDQVAEVYRRIPSQRLVVLGRAGSGKTVLAVRLVLDLLGERTPDTRVPVIVSLGSWNPDITLHDWLTAQLIRDHPWLAAVGADTRTLAAELVRDGWILPVLDGFDEIAPGLRPAVLRQLSADLPLVLTSRPEEYTAAMAGTRGVHRAAVITLTDLSLDDVKSYLRLATPKLAVVPDTPGSVSTRWDPVLLELVPAPRSPAAGNLAHALTTPLNVALARTIYSDAPEHDPTALLDPDRFRTVEDLDYHLLSNLVPSIYRARLARQNSRRGPSWNPEQAQRWLGLLAAHLERLETGDLAWWELGASLSRRTRTLVVAVLSGLIFGGTTAIGNLPVDLVATSRGLGFAVQRGLVVGVLHGIIGGIAFGLMYLFADSRQALKPSPVRIRLTGGPRQLGARLVARVRIGVLMGLVFGLSVVLVDRLLITGIGLDDGVSPGSLLTGVVEFTLQAGVGVAVVLGLMTWLEAPIDPANAVSPAGLLAENRLNVLVQMLGWALVFGVEFGLVASFTASPVRSLETGLVFGIEAAFAGGLGYGLSLTAWGQWVALARIWLPLTGRLPWRLITFLDDACQRGALRQAGAVYQFRHAQLQRHLTTIRPPHPPPSLAHMAPAV